MSEFLLLLRSEGDHCGGMSPEDHKTHTQKVINYIQNLTKEGKLKGAQPLTFDGVILGGKKGAYKDGPFNETKEIIAGYFLILAKDYDEAIEIARAHPVFEDTDKVRIEVRQIKHEEGIN